MRFSIPTLSNITYFPLLFSMIAAVVAVSRSIVFPDNNITLWLPVCSYFFPCTINVNIYRNTHAVVWDIELLLPRKPTDWRMGGGKANNIFHCTMSSSDEDTAATRCACHRHPADYERWTLRTPDGIRRPVPDAELVEGVVGALRHLLETGTTSAARDRNSNDDDCDDDCDGATRRQKKKK